METYTLNNGMKIPVIGFGCYNAKGGDNYAMFSEAVKNGYRLFDTASFYETERELGRALRDSGVKREEFFIQTKLWTDEMGYDNVMAAVERSLKRIGTDYIDIYMIHWPRVSADSTPSEWKSLQKETYLAMEKLVEDGTIRAIGLSNFLPHHLENIFSFCNIAPVADQLELHLGYMQERAINYAGEHDLRLQAWSPLGRGNVLNDKRFTTMAEKYGVTVSQMALNFLYRYGIIPLPKSAGAERQRQNLDIFGFTISEEDFSFLACLPNTLWSGEHPDFAIPALKSNLQQ